MGDVKRVATTSAQPPPQRLSFEKKKIKKKMQGNGRMVSLQVSDRRKT